MGERDGHSHPSASQSASIWRKPMTKPVEGCSRCGGSGVLDEWGFAMELCPNCRPLNNTTADIAAWAKDGCPEGVSGMPEDVENLLTHYGNNPKVEDQADEITRLRAENERLRGALQLFVKDHEEAYSGGYPEDPVYIAACAALQKTGDE